jgi:hypothetical protein
MNETDSGAIEERLALLERGVKRGKRATTVSSTRATRGPSLVTTRSVYKGESKSHVCSVYIFQNNLS